jgi:hypothetical protein
MVSRRRERGHCIFRRILTPGVATVRGRSDVADRAGSASPRGRPGWQPGGGPAAARAAPDVEANLARGKFEHRMINRTSPGKDRTITCCEHALVFPELRQVTCGRVVHKPVDNRRDVRITGGIPWTTLWTGKKLSWNSRGLLRGSREGRRNTFTVGNGHHPGATPETRERPGNRYFVRVPGPGGVARGAGEAGQLAELKRRGQTRPPSSHT